MSEYMSLSELNSYKKLIQPFSLSELNSYKKLIQTSNDFSSMGIWYTNKMTLKNIQERIILPQGTRVKYANPIDSKLIFVTDNSLFNTTLGQVSYNHNEENQTLDCIIDAYSGSDTKHKFVMGHEEGHIADKTGNLVVLWNAAKQLGYEFSCFSEEYAKASDNSTQKMFYGGYTEDDLQKSWKKPFNEQELLAHIGGFITLIKANVNPDLIRKFEQAIRSNSESHVRTILERNT